MPMHHRRLERIDRSLQRMALALMSVLMTALGLSIASQWLL